MDSGWITGHFDGESIGDRVPGWSPEHRRYDLVLSRGRITGIERIPTLPDVAFEARRCSSCGQEYPSEWTGGQCETCLGPLVTWRPHNRAPFAVTQPVLREAVFDLPDGPVRCELQDVTLVDWTLEHRAESVDQHQCHGWVKGRIYGRLALPSTAATAPDPDPRLPETGAVEPLPGVPAVPGPASGCMSGPGCSGCGSFGCSWLLGLPILGLGLAWLFGWPVALLGLGILLLALLFGHLSAGTGAWPLGCGGLLGLGLLTFMIQWLFGWPIALLCLGGFLLAFMLWWVLRRFGPGGSLGCLTLPLILVLLVLLPVLLWKLGGAGLGCLGILAILLLTGLAVGLVLAIFSGALRLAAGLLALLVFGFLLWGLLTSIGRNQRHDGLRPWGPARPGGGEMGSRPVPAFLPRPPWEGAINPVPTPEAQAKKEFEEAKAAPEGGDLLSIDEALKDPEAFFTDSSRRVYLSGGLLFASDSYQIGPAGDGDLQKLAQLLRKRPDAKILLEGHADTRGTEAHNLELSGNRAHAIKKRLVDTMGIDPDQVQILGKGSVAPLVPTGDREAQGPNRRVEVRVIPRMEEE